VDPLHGGDDPELSEARDVVGMKVLGMLDPPPHVLLVGVRLEGGLEGTVVAVSSESVFLDIGYKTEGIIPLAEFQKTGDTVKPGDKMPVSIKGRDSEGYYELSRIKVERPKDWSSLEKAFADANLAADASVTSDGQAGYTAGAESVRMVHSFVFDGKEKEDFIRGLGIRFDVPLALAHSRIDLAIVLPAHGLIRTTCPG
jgi:hypothetical protein